MRTANFLVRLLYEILIEFFLGGSERNSSTDLVTVRQRTDRYAGESPTLPRTRLIVENGAVDADRQITRMTSFLEE